MKIIVSILLLHCVVLHDRAYNLRWYHPGLKKPLTKDFSKHHTSMQLRQPNRKPWRWPGGCLLWVMLLLEESMYYILVWNDLFITYCVLIETPENSRHGNRGRYYCGKRKKKGLQHVIFFCTVKWPVVWFFFTLFISISCWKTVDGMILEKPVDKYDAYKMLSRSVSWTFLTELTLKKQKIDSNMFIMLYNFNIFFTLFFFFFQLEWERAQCFHWCSYCPLPWERR